MVLSYLTYGPWKDPHGLQLSADRHLRGSDADSAPVRGHRAHVGLLLALAAARRLLAVPVSHPRGLSTRGRRSRPARGPLRRVFGATRALDGLSRLGCDVGSGRRARGRGAGGPAHPARARRLRVRRDHRRVRGAAAPVGSLLSAVLMSMFYIGGELSQSRLGLPKSLTGVFQGLLLFTLLACDTLRVLHRRRAQSPQRARACRPRWRRGVSGAVHALLFAASMNSGTVLALAALGLLVNERVGRAEPRRRGHDAGRRDRRLRDGGSRARRGRVASLAGAGAGACWRRCSACW